MLVWGYVCFVVFRVLEEFACSVAVTDRLDILHDNRPPQTVEQTDLRYRTALEVRF